MDCPDCFCGTTLPFPTAAQRCSCTKPSEDNSVYCSDCGGVTYNRAKLTDIFFDATPSVAIGKRACTVVVAGPPAESVAFRNTAKAKTTDAEELVEEALAEDQPETLETLFGSLSLSASASAASKDLANDSFDTSLSDLKSFSLSPQDLVNEHGALWKNSG